MFLGACNWIFTTDIIMGIDKGVDRDPNIHGHILDHSSIKPSSMCRFYSYIYYIRAFFDLFPTSDLLFMHVYDILGGSDLSWPVWYVISMSAALTILWTCPNVLWGPKKTTIATLSLGKSSRCIRSVLPSQCCNFQICVRVLCFSVFCMQIALFLGSHCPQQM